MNIVLVPDPLSSLLARKGDLRSDDVWPEWYLPIESTHIHEAGHAVVSTLGSGYVRSVKTYKNGYRGLAGRVNHIGSVRSVERDWPKWEIAEVVMTLAQDIAGAAAEIRHFGGDQYGSAPPDNWERDSGEAIRLLQVAAQFHDTKALSAMVDIALRDVVAMLNDDAAWSAVIGIAYELAFQDKSTQTVSGKSVRSRVSEVLPNGWDWEVESAQFAASAA